MTEIDKKLTDAVVSIILRHTKPERIWLFGSRVTDTANDNSDYDFAFLDLHADSSSLLKIRDDLEKLSTLLKIDVTNLNGCESRFVQRVMDTGRVLYSASKKLRAEDGLLYFSRALSRLLKIINEKDTLYQQGFGDVILDIMAKRFEFTFEMAWKALKRYLDFVGIDAKNPRAVFKEGFAQGLLKNEAIWLDMIEMRNLSSHIYAENEIAILLEKIPAYAEELTQLEKILRDELII